MYKSIITTLAILGLSLGCGSSSSTKIGVTGYNGFLIDSAVQNATWSCGEGKNKNSGVTDKDGKFGVCPIGSSVTLSIGNLILGTSKPTEDYIFSIPDIVGVDREDISHPTVRAISTLLLSLDADGDASNGLFVTEEAILSLNQKINEVKEFTVLEEKETLELIESVVENNPNVEKAPTIEEVTAHLQDTNGDIVDGTQSKGEEVKVERDGSTT